MNSQSDYHNFILDDSDGESTIGGGDGNGVWDGDGDGYGGFEGGEIEFDKNGYLDTKWITDIENQILLSEYQLFLKTDITRVSFQFVYLDRNKQCIQFVLPILRPYDYVLNKPNQINQSELLHIIHQYQSVRDKKKYYNFHSLLLYDFQMPDSNNAAVNNDIRWLSEYLGSSSGGVSRNHDEYGRVIEYTNLLSFDAIYFHPLIEMFHDLIGFTVVLYED
jgi:hypothetical protein